MAKLRRGQHLVLRVPRPPLQRHCPEGRVTIEHSVKAPGPRSGQLQQTEQKQDNDQVLYLVGGTGMAQEHQNGHPTVKP